MTLNFKVMSFVPYLKIQKITLNEKNRKICQKLKKGKQLTLETDAANGQLGVVGKRVVF
jgi:hypothetical protein